MEQGYRFLVLFLLAMMFSRAMCIRHHKSTNNNNGSSSSSSSSSSINGSFCLSWRLGVETNNVLPWRTVPTECLQYVENYMIHGQYEQDLDLIMEQAMSFVSTITLAGDSKDAWILDVDDTCISNLFYYKSKKYGCDPYDPSGFRAWAMKGWCTAIPSVLGMFNKLIDKGFKVIMLTGRDQETLGQITRDNLHNQGFIGYQRLVMRTAANKGQSAVKYKSEVRKQLEDEGYRIWGNVGDQWSDLQGNSPGNRTFKLPNPMYFVP
ncbi:acid phosphatase 1-like isoform X2 [Arachis stenosperma]|uniref:acid phosphatase 1-like isoform X2 n=1 Tax=Arachis stenosperma TaxID=217475 RepID=UPI0025ABFCCD|nr:acid phosphatase 1-like isoform X2 [Arachis stenosperma]